jgi:dihydroxyacetone kinase-like protein
MPEWVDYVALTHMLSAAVEHIRRAANMLSTLDAATGDGDHGAAMCKVADAIVETIAHRTDQDLSSLLSDIGWAVMGTDTGSTGPLYGSLFVGMSRKAAGPEPLHARAFASMLEAGVENLRQSTKAKPGDKTMIDALAPATEAIRTAADAGQPIGDILDAGASAAARGVEATRQMKAAFGRARNIGERSIGHLDPGAVSMSLFFAGLKEGFTNA